MLESLYIKNYKSIKEVHLNNLPGLIVIVGANASGKSNFADAIDFLALVFKEGLVAAVRAKGGYENICFRRAKRSKAGLTFSVTATPNPRDEGDKTKYQFSYRFTFRATKEAIFADYEVISETLRVDMWNRETCEQATLEIKREGDKQPSVRLEGSEGDFPGLLVTHEVMNRFAQGPKPPQDELVMNWFFMLWQLPLFSMLGIMIKNCKVYQISPQIARQTGIPERSPDLGRHGENLPAAVEYLKRSHPDSYTELLEHLSHTVPTIDTLQTKYVETKALGLYFGERGVGRRWFSQDVSDGTIQTVSIFLSLVDPRNRIIFTEEPENSLHPWILRHFMDCCKEYSTQKQIFLTTQSVVAVNETPLEALYVCRRLQGETRIDRAVDLHPEAQKVITNSVMGLGEYWDSGAIDGVPQYEEQLKLIEDV